MRRVVIISLLFVLVLTTASAYTRRSSDCSSCHSSSDPIAGYVYSGPVMILSVPGFVDPGKEFTVEVKFYFSDYDIENVILTISEDVHILSFDETTMEASGVKKSDIFSFTATAMEKGITKLSVTAEITVHYDHNTGDRDDRRTETIERSALVTVGTTTLTPSAWSIMMDEDGEVITLTANKDITDIEISPPDSVEAIPGKRSSLEANETLEVTLRHLARTRIEDTTIISWRVNGTPYAIGISTAYNPEEVGKTDYFSWVGRITGISSIILLLCSLVLGGMWNTSKYLNRKIKAKTRIRYHCGISWFLFSLALYHGITLLIGPYSRRLWNPFIILGEVSALAMLLVSLTGSFMKFSIKILGAKTWRRLHLYGTLVALVLGTIHGIRIGTDLDFIRESTYLSKVILGLLIICVLLSVILNLVIGRKRKRALEEMTPSGREEKEDRGTRFQFESETPKPETMELNTDGWGWEYPSESHHEDQPEDRFRDAWKTDHAIDEGWDGELDDHEVRREPIRGGGIDRTRKGQYGTGRMLDWDTKSWRGGGRYRREDRDHTEHYADYSDQDYDDHSDYDETYEDYDDDHDQYEDDDDNYNERYEDVERDNDHDNDHDYDEKEDLIEYEEDTRNEEDFWADFPTTRKK